MTRPNSLPLLPPWGVQCCFFCFLFFVSCFFNLLVSWFLVSWFVVGFPAMAKRNQNPKKQETRKKNDKTQLSATTLPLGVCNIVLFFCFFWFLGFLIFWFSGSLLVFWRAGKTTQKWRTLTSLFASSPTIGVANLLLVDLIGCFGPVVLLENHLQKMAKCRYDWRKLGGLGTQIRQFCLFI